jgi:hypothetical protein
MTQVIHDGFFKPVAEFSIPEDVGMYSDAANAAVRDALADFLDHASRLAEELGLDFRERLAAFQHLDVSCGEAQINYNDFFQYTPPDAYDSEGNPAS